MSDQQPIKHLDNIEEFIKHNLNIGYIKPDMTIEQLLKFIENVKGSYIPMMQQIENSINL